MTRIPGFRLPHDPIEASLTSADDRVRLNHWLPPQTGVVPRIRVGRRWINVLWAVPITFVLLVLAVAIAQALRELPAVQDFVVRYPGVPESVQTVTTGFPAWLRLQHFLNLFFMAFIIRSGVQILADHPRLYWKRDCTPGTEWFRFQKPVPTDRVWTAKDDSVTLPGWLGIPGIRHSIGLARWWHFSITLLWMINGIVFYALLFATDQWLRLVPTTWEVFPNAASTALQYLSLTFPAEQSWTRYNSLQQLVYFITVFIAAPTSILTGFMQSPAISNRLGLVRQGAKPAESAFDPFSRIVVVLTFHPRARDAGVHHRRAREPQYDVRRGERWFLARRRDLRASHGAIGGGLVVGLPLHDPSCPPRSEDRNDHGAAIQCPDRVVGPDEPADREGHFTLLLAERDYADVRRVRHAGC